MIFAFIATLLLIIIGLFLLTIGIISIIKKRIYFFTSTYIHPNTPSIFPFNLGFNSRTKVQEQFKKHPTTYAGFSFDNSDYIKLSTIPFTSIPYGVIYKGSKAIIYGIIFVILGISSVLASIVFYKYFLLGNI